ncbi:MAG: DNA topology modulation protein [Rhodothermales bacterium]
MSPTPDFSTMRRILIIGSSGSGKSTLAKHLGKRLDLPVIHLDAHYWNPGWMETPAEEWASKVHTLIQGEAWVMDGTYSSTLEPRIAAADTIVFLSFSRWRCLWWVFKRRIRYRNRTRPDMAPGCPERMEWDFVHYVLMYPNTLKPGILKKLDAARETKQVVVLETPREVERFVHAMRQVPTSS